MNDLLNNFNYIITEVNNQYCYKDCCLIDEIDDYLKKYNFIRKETSWACFGKVGWGDALYIKL